MFWSSSLSSSSNSFFSKIVRSVFSTLIVFLSYFLNEYATTRPTKGIDVKQIIGVGWGYEVIIGQILQRIFAVAKHSSDAVACKLGFIREWKICMWRLKQHPIKSV